MLLRVWVCVGILAAVSVLKVLSPLKKVVLSFVPVADSLVTLIALSAILAPFTASAPSFIVVTLRSFSLLVVMAESRIESDTINDGNHSDVSPLNIKTLFVTAPEVVTSVKSFNATLPAPPDASSAAAQAVPFHLTT